MADQLGHFYGNVNLSADAHAILGDVHHHHYAKEPAQKDNYDILYHSLSFEGMHSRLRNVEMALPQTCEWLRSHHDFLLWKDHTQASQHHGLLWIKGKPGSGKSTIMKDTLEWARKEWPHELILSYFFNARAPTELEKSCLGLYRSLTHQVLSSSSDLRSCFLEEFSSKEKNGEVERWTEVELQNFLLKLSGTGYLPHLNIFIDALDEGDYNDVWRMITFFEKTADCALSIGSSFRLCLSSRHYPQISIEVGLTIVLEDQVGHKQDIKVYIEKTLPGRSTALMDEIRESLFGKAEGVFLWVVLSISLLRPLHSRGRVKEMRRVLEALPTGLYELFFAIMTKDAEDLDDCITLLQWMLVRKQMLSARELYLGLQFRDPSPETDLDDLSMDVSMVTKYIFDCSKGLLELTEEAKEIKLGTEEWERFDESDLGVQFIHESVRQFLTSSDQTIGRVQNRRASTSDLSLDNCNLIVAEGCLHYLLRLCRGSPLTDFPFQEYPLAEYAAMYWWQHIQATNPSHNHRAICLAQELFTGRPESFYKWVQLYDIDQEQNFVEAQLRRNIVTRPLPQPLYYIASIGLPALLNTDILLAAKLDAREGCYGSSLQAASFRNHKEMVQLLLDNGADVNAQSGVYGSALMGATIHGHKDIVELLLDHGADINIKSKGYGNPISAASEHGHEQVVKILLDRGGGANLGERYGDALRTASRNGHRDLVRMILDQGMGNILDETPLGEALYLASAKGHEEVVRLLLDRGADVNARGGHLGRASRIISLHSACRVIQILSYRRLGQRDHRNYDGVASANALYAASEGGHADIVQILLAKGADVNTQAGSDGSALQVAAFHGEFEVVQILLDNGAHISVSGGRFDDALEAAEVGWTATASPAELIRERQASQYQSVIDLLTEHGSQITRTT